MAHGVSADVSRDHVPVSLRPFVLGLCVPSPHDQAVVGKEANLELYDAAEDRRPLADIRLQHVGAIALSRGTLQLYQALGCRNQCAPPFRRWTSYALSWRHARRAERRGDRLRMSAADLRCLNAYYMVPRPVFLVSVQYAERTNVFPMDLVGAVSSGEFLLALRETSPAVALMEESRRIAMSAAPASQLRVIHDLGAHHRLPTVDVAAIPLAFSTSPTFNLPVLAGGGLVREITIHTVHRIGSHVLFAGTIESESGHTRGQLAHVSAMYAEWLSRARRPLEVRE